MITSSKQLNKKTGNQGELIAIDHLLHNNKGFFLLERNFSCKIGEIDIIMQCADQIIFIEVKARTSLLYGQPYESITKPKMAKIRRVAEYYVMKNKLWKANVRFDVVSILIDKIHGNHAIEHLVAAF